MREIQTQANAVFQKAIIDPSVDFGSLELVLVITNFDANEALPDFQASAPVSGTVPVSVLTPAPTATPGSGGETQETTP
ncbi:MAG: hypothetical protein IPK16_25355 [Anaerolineales bacterium]|nr:hypothetical protein [Anaerolineales bacterium]